MDMNLSGRRLAQVRKEQKITQAQVAEKTGMNMQYYSRIERGLVNFGIDKLMAITQVLDVSYDYLLDETLLENETRARLVGRLHRGIRQMNEAELTYLLTVMDGYFACKRTRTRNPKE